MMMAQHSPVRPFADGRRVLLFVDRRLPSAGPAEDRFADVSWPDGTHTEVIDISSDDEHASWYGIADVPAVAVVLDGAILAIEYECDAEACARVCEAACHRDPRTLEGLYFRRMF